MSLGVVFKGPEGIVLAADSRVTLTAEGKQGEGDNEKTLVLHASYDNATKLLKVKGQEFVGAVTYGTGAIGADGRAPRTAHSYLPEFENELAESGRLPVEEFANRLSTFFQKQWDGGNMPDEADSMIFLVGGFDPRSAYGRVFQIDIPRSPLPIEQNSGEEFGVTWGGQLQTATRLLAGYDPAVFPVIQKALQLDESQTEALQKQVDGIIAPSAMIPYAFLPLQDSVDLAILMIKTTAAIQRFSIGIRGVGGAIDVATITRTEGFRAVQQKTVIGERRSEV